MSTVPHDYEIRISDTSCALSAALTLHKACSLPTKIRVWAFMWAKWSIKDVGIPRLEVNPSFLSLQSLYVHDWSSFLFTNHVCVRRPNIHKPIKWASSPAIIIITGFPFSKRPSSVMISSFGARDLFESFDWSVSRLWWSFFLQVYYENVGKHRYV